MEVAKSMQDDIMKIQNELMTAIQNHQVLVQRQRVNPTESIKTQIEEVQRHIICLGESQKILVTRLRNEIESQSLRVNKTHKPTLHQRFHSKSITENDRFHKPKTQDLGRNLLIKAINSRERSLLKTSIHRTTSDSDKITDQKTIFLNEWQPVGDSSSEENRTPCELPLNGKSEENERRSVKRSLAESNCNPSKRPKSTLQATPRPSSPVPVRTKVLDALSSSSEESLDSLLSQQPESENKIDFALALGLITNEVYSKVIKKKSERRKRRVSSQHHLYNDLWDLTVLQKRNRVKEVVPEDTENVSRDCPSPNSNSDNLCFICRKPGDLYECSVCQTGCHTSCVATEVCPACTHHTWSIPVNPLIAEKRKELEQLKINRKELIKSKTKLQEKAKLLSASLVMQTATVNQLVSKEDRIHESIKKLTDFLVFIQGSSKPNS